MARARWSRTAQPLDGRAPGGAMGTWGAALTVVVLLMFVAGMATAALYLETGQPEQLGAPSGSWPPPGFARPSPLYAAGAWLAVLSSSVAFTLAARRLGAGSGRRAAGGLVAGGAASVLAVVLLSADLGAVSFRWDEHAYTSVYWVLTATTLVFATVTVVMALAVGLQMLTGVVDRERHLEIWTSAIYAWFVTVTAAVLLGLTHLLPIVGGAP